MAVERVDGAFMDCKESASDLTGKEGYLAKRTAAGKFDLAGEDEAVAGIITEGRPAGKHTSIKTGPQPKAVCGDPISVGDRVQSDSSGRAVAGSTNTFATAISATTAAGQLVELEWDKT